MQVNARVDYAIRAVVEVAASGGELVRKRRLSEAQEIPERFLENILAQLVRTRILAASRGPQGGYTLERDAVDITIADIVRAVDGPLAAVRGIPPERLEYPQSSAVLRDVWVAVRSALRTVLERVTIDDLVRGELPEDVRELVSQPGAWERR
ncbi:MAG: Rrf2 family transcriptional regulator [Microbacteriaceae bacterium]